MNTGSASREGNLPGSWPTAGRIRVQKIKKREGSKKGDGGGWFGVGAPTVTHMSGRIMVLRWIKTGGCGHT